MVSVLWMNGLTLDVTSDTAKAHEGVAFIAKADVNDKDIRNIMKMAIFGVYSLISVDVLRHLNVLIALRAYIMLLYHRSLVIEFVLHVILLVFQIQYSLMLAQFSFLIIW